MEPIERASELEALAGVEANRKVVFICHPLRGDIRGNIARVREICTLALQAGVIPFAPHLYFTQFLNDELPHQRALGIAYGLEFLRRFDELWVVGSNLTEGMKGEIQFAQWIGIPIRNVELDGDKLLYDELYCREAAS